MSEPPFNLTPIDCLHSSRNDLQDDDWDSVRSRIALEPESGPEAVDGVEVLARGIRSSI